MADRISADRLLPCLLDRLTDELPESATESADRRVISLRRYRQGVRRDLENLLNSCRHSDDEPLSEFPEVAASVLNFGIPDLCGQTVSGLNVSEMERKIREAILLFEPRIVRETLSVRAATEAGSSRHHKALCFEISGDLWALPAPDPLYYRTEVDLETGAFQIKDRSHG